MTGPLRPGLVWEQPARSVEWYTPEWVFDRLGIRFDLDPCSPESGPVPWVPADRFVDPVTNGLWVEWEGRVWCNPPFGRAAVPFIERMIAHRDGILLVPNRTDTRWWQMAAESADAIAFVAGRIDFVPEAGVQKRPTDEGSGPGAGTTLLGWGTVSIEALLRARLGWTVVR